MSSATKQPFKRIEVPLNKFTQEIVPHHELLVAKNKKNAIALLTQAKQCPNDMALKKELQDIKKNVRQLKDLMYELDTLRAQVEDVDLDRFDSKTLSCRKIVLTIIAEYNSLHKQIEAAITTNKNCSNDANVAEENSNPFHGAQQIQISENLDNLKLKHKQNVLRNVENIQNEIEEIHGIYENLGQMVTDQKVYVDKVESTTVTTLDNVHEGNKLLKACSKMKTAAYPLTGAFIGTCIGGPIGLVAGLKVGSIAAVGLGVAGYTGGRFMKTYNNCVADTEENEEPGVVVGIEKNKDTNNSDLIKASPD